MIKQNLPFTDRSGTIASGGTAQDVYTSAQAPKRGLEFYNTSDTAMIIDFGRTAAAATGIPVAAGAGHYQPGPSGVVPTGRLSVLCATTGKTFTCKTF